MNDKLIDELSAGIADLTEAAKSGNVALEEIAAGLAEMSEALAAFKIGESMDKVAAAIKAIKITSPVSVNVSPTPLTITPVVQVLDRAPKRIVVDFSYDSMGRAQRAVISQSE